MRVLCAALAGAGFCFPTIAIARELARRGHTVRFVTDVSFAPLLASYSLERIPRTSDDGPSFTVSGMFEPERVAMQFVHLRYAAQQFAPDVVLSSHLTLGSALFCSAHDVPLTVVGPVVYLWPLEAASAHADSAAARAAIGRFAELRAAFHRAARSTGIRSSDDKLLGDRHVLQGVAALEAPAVPDLPTNVRLVGSCLLDTGNELPARVTAWIAAAREARRPIALVQLGRTFGAGHPWPAIRRWAAGENVALIASLERYDGGVDANDDDVLVHDGIPLERIAPLVDFCICSGMPSALLAAARAARPMIVVRSGSGTAEHASAFTGYGCALSFAAAEATPALVAQLARRLLGEPSFALRARELQAEFARYDGPALAASEVEAVAGVPA